MSMHFLVLGKEAKVSNYFYEFKKYISVTYLATDLLVREV